MRNSVLILFPIRFVVFPIVWYLSILFSCYHHRLGFRFVIMLIDLFVVVFFLSLCCLVQCPIVNTQHAAIVNDYEVYSFLFTGNLNIKQTFLLLLLLLINLLCWSFIELMNSESSIQSFLHIDFCLLSQCLVQNVDFIKFIAPTTTTKFVKSLQF